MPRHFFCCFLKQERRMFMPENNPQILIRNGLLKDVDDLVELLHELFSLEVDFEFNSKCQRKGFEFMLAENPDRMVWVAEIEGKVVGMCTAQVLISTAEGGEAALVEDVLVRTEYRGIGIGRKLMAALEKWAIKRGIHRLQLLADHENAPALEFYSKLGWWPTQLGCWRRKV
jgi:GNAT superfamily N-acetyltransferase